MTHSVKLPNGFIMNNVPDDATQQQIASRAVEKGYATADDFASFPEIYAQLAPAKITPAEKALGVTPEMAAALQAYANNPTTKAINNAESDIMSIASWAALPELKLGRVAQLSAEALINTGATVADDALETKREGGDGITNPTTDVLEGVLSVPAGHAIGKAAEKIAAPLLERFSPRVAAYAKGLFSDAPIPKPDAPIIMDMPPAGGAAGKVTEIPAEEMQDIIPRGDAGQAPQAGQNPVTGEISKGINKAAGESALGNQAEGVMKSQEQWRNDFQELAIRRLSATEAKSYFLSQLQKQANGSLGAEFGTALDFYRDFTSGYASGATPHPAVSESYWHLADVPYYEAMMRRDSPEIDKMIQDYEMGAKVNTNHAIDALKGYEMKMHERVKDFVDGSPKAHLIHIIKMSKETPELAQWLDVGGIANPDNVEKITKSMYDAHAQGVRDAMKNKAENVLGNVKQEYTTTAQELDRTPTDKPNVITALKHKKATLQHMQSDLEHFIETGEFKKRGNGSTSHGLDANAEAIYEAMGLTHDGAKRGLDVLNQFREIRSVASALPEVRKDTYLDKLLDNTAAHMAGAFVVGGAPAAIAAPVIKTAAKKAVNGARTLKRRRRNKALVDELVKKSHE